MGYKVLGQADPGAVLTDIYTVPANTQAVSSSVIVCNQETLTAKYRISVAVGGAADSTEQYLAYDVEIPGNTSVDWTIGMTLDDGDVVRVETTVNGPVSFNVFGEEVPA